MKKNTLIVALILLIFFVISFLTNILGPIIPDIIDSFTLSIGLAGFLPFAFFVAYAVMSIPSGILVEKYKEKKMLIFAFTMAFIGALLFAFIPSFTIALTSLFIIGIGMAVLQVVINPLLRTAGGEEHFAFNSVMGQLAFGAASFLSPMLYSYLVTNIHTTDNSLIFSFLNPMVPENLKWVSLYWVFAAIAFLMVIIVYFAKFPKVELKEDEKIDVGVAFKELLANKYVLLYFLGIFCYVGTEQGIANWISKFLQSYHDIDPSTTGAIVISYFWGLLTVGCLLGLVLLKFLDSRTVLIFFTGGAILALLAGLFGPANVALIAFPLTGFFASVMWSIIFSLALNSVPHHHGTFSGILCTGIAGGAIVPLIIGGLAELVGLKLSMLFLLFTLGYILSIGIWAKPLVTNATKSLKDIFK
ncbi:MFS transporter [Cyclobacterium sp. 1_MG-2023]|uniref:Major facilitator superfamily MFS_1 n=1 Tax=Cyclobacterium marinum (strain ATCC 25205 / DSM 745 / LMG 13164 / NCIMB 1802) TaxID=880070 RepID=G0J156_CYCMS|nr:MULTISPECIES: MFS transporter [Cyclobacterium]AEL25805.1 major facilitator superfamily MFS_1 [Cyclobacterium marinum DSM 745]MBI0401235.1 MFS transporter [Cyclobacterium marinum]MDO6438799.1 MFS transporter [Cyclobacterium sp. 1_MG-2023]|tara:strand:+ start:6376 stop:7623 length:1248 start_codon:yes stop_codon:yes gene_type:complete